MNEQYCDQCHIKFPIEKLKRDVFIWLTLGESSGFKTNNFNICGKCTGLLLYELKQHIEKKLGIEKLILKKS